MKVYTFDDYLKTVRSSTVLLESDVICEIEKIEDLPMQLCEIQGKTAQICMISPKEDFVCIHYINGMPKKDSLSFKDEITCPHCGDEESDSWEAGDSDENRECGVCGSIFSYERNCEVTYSSTIVERNDNILKIS
jgi:hypothetical protein